MNLETKASIGDLVYFVKKIKTQICPVCEGSGKIHIGSPIKPNFESPDTFVGSISEQFVENVNNAIEGNLREYDCPECKGKGITNITGQPRYEISSGIVSAIEAVVKEGYTGLVYRVNEAGSQFTLSEDKMWLKEDEANRVCYFMNLERRIVPLDKVFIPSAFEVTIPCNEKLMKRLDEWRKHKSFNTEIYVHEDMYLFDGYTSYLVYRMLGIANIPVVIWPNKKV